LNFSCTLPSSLWSTIGYMSISLAVLHECGRWNLSIVKNVKYWKIKQTRYNIMLCVENIFLKLKITNRTYKTLFHVVHSCFYNVLCINISKKARMIFVAIFKTILNIAPFWPSIRMKLFGYVDWSKSFDDLDFIYEFKCLSSSHSSSMSLHSTKRKIMFVHFPCNN
jgi:hypothetical protein